MSADMSLAAEADAMCRICHCTVVENPEGGPLLSPCACSGGLGHVCQRCLVIWVCRRVEQGGPNPATCELCRQRLSDELVESIESMGQTLSQQLAAARETERQLLLRTLEYERELSLARDVLQRIVNEKDQLRRQIAEDLEARQLRHVITNMRSDQRRSLALQTAYIHEYAARLRAEIDTAGAAAAEAQQPGPAGAARGAAPARSAPGQAPAAGQLPPAQQQQPPPQQPQQRPPQQPQQRPPQQVGTLREEVLAAAMRLDLPESGSMRGRLLTVARSIATVAGGVVRQLEEQEGSPSGGPAAQQPQREQEQEQEGAPATSAAAAATAMEAPAGQAPAAARPVVRRGPDGRYHMAARPVTTTAAPPRPGVLVHVLRTVVVLGCFGTGLLVGRLLPRRKEAAVAVASNDAQAAEGWPQMGAERGRGGRDPIFNL